MFKVVAPALGEGHPAGRLGEAPPAATPRPALEEKKPTWAAVRWTTQWQCQAMCSSATALFGHVRMAGQPGLILCNAAESVVDAWWPGGVPAGTMVEEGRCSC